MEIQLKYYLKTKKYVSLMGGHALKNTNVVRMDLITFNKIKSDILNMISDEITIEYPYENPEKTTFGDIDILYQAKENINMFTYIVNKFNPKEILSNGNVISFAYKLENESYVQIDFIKCQNMKMAKFYYSYGDVGQIIGMAVKHYGKTGPKPSFEVSPQNYSLSFGDSGLFIKKLFEDTQDKLYLSDNPEDICVYLDLDYSKWGHFTTEEEIFIWLSSSKLLYSKIFVEGNHKHYARLKLRPMYTKFIAWFDKPIQYNKQNDAIEYFNKREEVNEMIKNNNMIKQRKLKFNGNNLIQLKVVNDQKELGNFIKNFKTHINKTFNDFDTWLDTNDLDTINNYIIEYFYQLN